MSSTKLFYLYTIICFMEKSNNTLTKGQDRHVDTPRFAKSVAHATRRSVVTVYSRTGNHVIIPYPAYLTQPVKLLLGRELPMNPVQYNLYRLLRKGLNFFTPEDVQLLSEDDRKRVDDNHKQAEYVIQRLKYDKYYGPYDALLNNMTIIHSDGSVHKLSNDAKLGIHKSDVNQVPRTATLKKLGITTEQICQAFITAGLLPANFFTINPEELTL